MRLRAAAAAPTEAGRTSKTVIHPFRSPPGMYSITIPGSVSVLPYMWTTLGMLREHRNTTSFSSVARWWATLSESSGVPGVPSLFLDLTTLMTASCPSYRTRHTSPKPPVPRTWTLEMDVDRMTHAVVGLDKQRKR